LHRNEFVLWHPFMSGSGHELGTPGTVPLLPPMPASQWENLVGRDMHVPEERPAGLCVARRALIGQADRVVDEEPWSWCRDLCVEARLEDASVDEVAGTDGPGHMDLLGQALAFGGGPT